MSRSFGERLFTIRSPIVIVPSVIASSPAIMRSAVVLPQPDRPDEDEKLAVRDIEREILDGVDASLVDLVHLFELHLSHVGPPRRHTSLQAWNAGPSAGSTAWSPSIETSSPASVSSAVRRERRTVDAQVRAARLARQSTDSSRASRT